VKRVILAALVAIAALAIAATASAGIRITKVYFDPPGADTGSNKSLNAERVKITNTGPTMRTLRGWKLRDRQGHVYTLGLFALGPGDALVVHTGRGNPNYVKEPQQTHWRLDSYVWDNDGDQATLKNKRGRVVDRCSYSGAGHFVQCSDASRQRPAISMSDTTFAPVPSAEPTPIEGQGYDEVFRDDFDALGSTLWGEGVWYAPSAPSNSIFVRDGVLNLVSRRSQDYRDITVTTEAGASPAIFKQGYFEARMRWTGGNGAWPAFWLASYRHATTTNGPGTNPYCAANGLPAAECWNAELDIFEGQGSEPDIYYGTLHRNTDGRDGGPADEVNPNARQVVSDLTTDFHTYGVLWTASSVTWYLDGQALMSAPVYDSTNQPLFLILQMWIGGWTTGTDDSTPDELKTQVDYVSVWQR